MERWFRHLTEDVVRNGSFESVKELTAAILNYLQERNLNPKPYQWPPKGADILAKIQRSRDKLSKLLFHFAPSDVRVGFCLPEHQLLDQPVKELADMFRTSAVETKRVFVQIPLKVLSRNATLVSCAQPAFEQRRNKVDMRKVFEGTFRIAKHRRHPVAVSGLADTVVPDACGPAASRE